jgi:hypothetical protein
MQKKKTNQSKVEMKPPNLFYYGYELCQKLAYIKDEIEMLDQLPKTRSPSCHYKIDPKLLQEQ